MRGSPGRADGRIVVGVDGGAASLTAVRWSAQEARLRQASVHLVFVRDGFRRAPYAGLPKASPADQDDADGRAPLVTAELEAGWIVLPGRLSSELAHGSPAKVLIDRSAGAELLVLGAACPEVQPASEAPPLVGPVARACLHRAACPVVVVATSDGSARRRISTRHRTRRWPGGRPRLCRPCSLPRPDRGPGHGPKP
jgi:nucleotide-binding universal stress UspA family protein